MFPMPPWLPMPEHLTSYPAHLSWTGEHALSYTALEELLQWLHWPARQQQAGVCRSTASQLEDGSQVKVKGKKVTSMFGGWGLKKKLEQTFAPGSPVIIRGKVFSKNGAPCTCVAFSPKIYELPAAEAGKYPSHEVEACRNASFPPHACAASQASLSAHCHKRSSECAVQPLQAQIDAAL